MTGPFGLASETRRVELSAQQIAPIQSSALRVESKDGDSEFVGPIDSLREHTMAHEYQAPPAVGRRNRCCSNHVRNVQVAALVVDPRQVTRTVEITRLNRCSGGHNGVYSTEVDHPLAAQRDCFIVRCTARLRLGRLLFHMTSLPETAVLARCDRSPRDRMSAHAPSLTPPTSSRRNDTIGDWS